MFMWRVLRDMKNIEGEKATNIGLKGKRKKKMVKKAKNIAYSIGEFIDKLGKWDEARKGVMSADADEMKEWMEDEKEREETTTRDLIKNTADSVAILAAKGGFASKGERKRAEKKKREREEERKADGKQRVKQRAVSKLSAQEKKEEVERKEEEEKKRQALGAEDLRKEEIRMYVQQCDKYAKAMQESEGKEKEEMREKVAELNAKIKEAKERRVTYEGQTYKYSTGGKRTRTRMVFVVSTHMGLEEGRRAEEQLDRMKNKLNELLRVEKGCDGEAPFGFIEQVKNTGAWGDKSERRWRISGVHEEEP